MKIDDKQYFHETEGFSLHSIGTVTAKSLPKRNSTCPLSYYVESPTVLAPQEPREQHESYLPY